MTKERPKELRGHLCSDVVTEVRSQCKSLATLVVPMLERSGDPVAVAGTQYLGTSPLAAQAMTAFLPRSGFMFTGFRPVWPVHLFPRSC